MVLVPSALTSICVVLPVTSGFDEYSKLLNELIQKEGKDGNNYNFLRKLEAGFQMTKVLEPGILKTKNFERMANDLDRHLQVRNIKHQTQFDKLSAIGQYPSYKRSWCRLLAWFWCHQH
jgi:hypothetical protein